MAVHDYVIDNSTGANVRADINNALAAIVSNNSSSSEPSTTKYAYMWWADTTNGVLKIRNSANDGWVELLQLDGTLTLEDGSASTPALAFRDDLNTGIFSSAADTFNVATAGVERMELGATTIFNESGADVDFRIEGDTEANLFYVDAGNNHIGINDSTPSVTLDITGEGGGNGEVHVKRTSGASCFIQAQSATAVFGSNSNHAVSLKSNSTTALTIDSSQNVGIGTTTPESKFAIKASSGSGDLFSISDIAVPTSGDEYGVAMIKSNAAAYMLSVTGYNSNAKGIRIYNNGGSTGRTSFEIAQAAGTKFIVDGGGLVGIGHDTPSSFSSAANDLVINGSNAGMTISTAATETGSIFFADGTSTASQGRIRYDHSDDNMHFSTATNERMRILSGGAVCIGRTTETVDHNNFGTSIGAVLSHSRAVTAASQSAAFYGAQGYAQVMGDGDLENTHGRYGSLSDETLKENIIDANSQWNDIKNIKVRNFNFKESTGYATHKQIGVIAQELETVCPNLVSENDQGIKAVASSVLYMKAVKALQEAIAKIEVLETKVATLEAA